MANWQPLVEELVATRRRSLVAYAVMLTGSHARAEDFVQDALIETFSRKRTFPHVGAAEAYVRRVLASRFIDDRRRAKVEQRAFGKVGVMDVDPGAGPELLVEHSSDVRDALSVLSPRERACVVLRYLEHLTTRETSEALKISEGSVKRYLSDGIRKLNVVFGTDVNPDDLDIVPITAEA